MLTHEVVRRNGGKGSAENCVKLRKGLTSSLGGCSWENREWGAE